MDRISAVVLELDNFSFKFSTHCVGILSGCSVDVLGKPMLSKTLADGFDDGVEIRLRAVSLTIDLSKLFPCERRSILRKTPQLNLTDFLMSDNISLQLGLVRTAIHRPATEVLNSTPDLRRSESR